MDERDLETEEPAARHAVDQLRTCGLQLTERGEEILGLERDVMHPGAAAREKAPDWRVVVGRRHELDATRAQEKRRRLHSLLLERLAVLELGAEEALVGGDCLVEVGHRETEVVNGANPHAGDAIRGG
jgi:hypothetical protein